MTNEDIRLETEARLQNGYGLLSRSQSHGTLFYRFATGDVRIVNIDDEGINSIRITPKELRILGGDE